jgi:hypothetical protein
VLLHRNKGISYGELIPSGTVLCASIKALQPSAVRVRLHAHVGISGQNALRLAGKLFLVRHCSHNCQRLDGAAESTSGIPRTKQAGSSLLPCSWSISRSIRFVQTRNQELVRSISSTTIYRNVNGEPILITSSLKRYPTLQPPKNCDREQ